MAINQKKAGVALSYASELIKILTTLIYTPIMLRLLGQSEYGLYQLVYSVVSYLGLLNLGFTASYVRYYSRFNENGKQSEIAKLNGMFMTFFLVISGIALLCGFVMVANIKSIFQTGLTESEYATARVLMLLMIVNLAITFPNSVFTCITSAHERFFFQRLLLVLQNILNPFLTLPLLIKGFGSIGMVVISTIITMAQLTANIWFVCFKLKEKFIFKEFNTALLEDIWNFTFFIFLNQIIDQINWSVDRFLLGRMIGTTTVAIYGLGAQINTMYVQLSSSISSVFVPKVNRIVAKDDNSQRLSLLFTSIGRLQFMVLSLVLTGFIILGRPFIQMWGGKDYTGSYYVALFLIIPVTVPLIQNIGIEIQRAKNKHRVRSVVYFCIAICNILLSIPLIKKYGAVGASAGTAISLTLGNILFMNWYYMKYIKIDIISFWKSIGSFFPAFIVPLIIGIGIMKLVKITDVMQLVIWIIVYTVVYSISMWLVGMNDDERKLFSNLKKGTERN